MESYTFSVVIQEHQGGYKACCPEIEECTVYCDTYGEALDRIKDAIKNRIAQKLMSGEEFDQPEIFCPLPFAIQYCLN